MDNLDEMELKLLRKMNQEKDAEITSLKEENERLVKWVDDLLCILRTLLWATGQGSVFNGRSSQKTH